MSRPIKLKTVIEQNLEGMSIEDLKIRFKKLKKGETHYRELRQQTEAILQKKVLTQYIEEKGFKV
jgi:hypothetical protein